MRSTFGWWALTWSGDHAEYLLENFCRVWFTCKQKETFIHCQYVSSTYCDGKPFLRQVGGFTHESHEWSKTNSLYLDIAKLLFMLLSNCAWQQLCVTSLSRLRASSKRTASRHESILLDWSRRVTFLRVLCRSEERPSHCPSDNPLFQ